jgi:hypothetical protein
MKSQSFPHKLTVFNFVVEFLETIADKYIVPELPLFEEHSCNASAHLHTIKTLPFVVKLYYNTEQ